MRDDFPFKSNHANTRRRSSLGMTAGAAAALGALAGCGGDDGGGGDGVGTTPTGNGSFNANDGIFTGTTGSNTIDEVSRGAALMSVDAAEGDDTINTGEGVQEIIGGAGNDTIDGGMGDDIAAYVGGRAGFTVRATLGADADAAVVTVTDTATMGDDEANEGTDTLTSINQLRFNRGGMTDEWVNVGLVFGTNAGDTALEGTANADIIFGFAGNDTITGMADDDTMDGGEGDDTIIGGAGDDTIDGGGGTDTAVFAGAVAGYRVSATFDAMGMSHEFTVTDTETDDDGDAATVDDEGTDTLVGIEAIRFGTAAMSIVTDPADDGRTAGDAEIIVGDDNPDGESGSEVDGGGGNDLMFGLDGADFLSGGAGDDTIDGGAGDDTITGGAGDDTIDGGEGDDTITGGAGDDTIDGGEGDDTAVFAGTRADYGIWEMTEGTGSDMVTRVVVLHRAADGDLGRDTLTNVEMVMFGTETAITLDGYDGFDNVTPITVNSNAPRSREEAVVVGSSAIMIPAAPWFSAMGDSVTYTVAVTMGTDTVNGAAEIDMDSGMVTFTPPTVAGMYTVTVTASHELLGTEVSHAHVIDVETSDSTSTSATAGNDTLPGLAGGGNLEGLAGNDTFISGAGNDNFFGTTVSMLEAAANEMDKVVFEGEVDDYTISAELHTFGPSGSAMMNVPRITVMDNDTTAPTAAPNEGTDTLVGIESVEFRGGGGLELMIVDTGTAEAEILLGDQMANATLNGLAGDDFIFGFAMDDTIDGGDGDDTIEGGAGDDTIDGGDGADTAVFAGARADYRMWQMPVGSNMVIVQHRSENNNLGRDTLTNVEMVRFGTENAITLAEYDGFDVVMPLMVNTGAPTARDIPVEVGSAAIMFPAAPWFSTMGDSVTYTVAVTMGTNMVNDAATIDTNSGMITFTAPTAAGMYTVTVTATHDLLRTVVSHAHVITVTDEAVSTTQSPDDDLLTADATGGNLEGLAGDDTFFSRAGNDNFFGNTASALEAAEDEMDKVVYAGVVGDYSISAELHTFGTGNDAETNVPRITVTDNNMSAPATNPDEGTDTLVGIESVEFRGGANALVLMIVGTGTDSPEILLGDEMVNSALNGMNGADFIFGFAMNDTINGGAGDDMIDGGAGNDTIDGGDDDDTIIGGDDVDMITGGSGDDTITGEGGNDTIDGGSDNDTAIYSGAWGTGTGYRIFWDYGAERLKVLDIDTGTTDEGEDTLQGIETIRFSDRIFTVINNPTSPHTGGATHDVIIGDVSSGRTFNGGDGDDFLFGGDEADVLSGGAGNDSLYGERHDDTLSGGAGNDTLYGGVGNDDIYGNTSGAAGPSGDMDTVDFGRTRVQADVITTERVMLGSTPVTKVIVTNGTEEDELRDVDVLMFGTEMIQVANLPIWSDVATSQTVMGATSITPINVTMLFDDADNKGELEYEVTNISGTGLAFNTGNNMITGTPSSIDDHVISIKATDPTLETGGTAVTTTRMYTVTREARALSESTDIPLPNFILDSGVLFGGVDITSSFVNPDNIANPTYMEVNALPNNLSLSSNGRLSGRLSSGQGQTDIGLRITAGGSEFVAQFDIVERMSSTLNGTAEDDLIFNIRNGGAYNESETIDGGGGDRDVVVYRGARNDYRISEHPTTSGLWVVEDKILSVGGGENEGRDTLTNVEYLRFTGSTNGDRFENSGSGDDVRLSDSAINPDSPGAIFHGVSGETTDTIGASDWDSFSEDASAWFVGGGANVKYSLSGIGSTDLEIDENSGMITGMTAPTVVAGSPLTLDLVITASNVDDQIWDDITHTHRLTVENDDPVAIATRTVADVSGELTRVREKFVFFQDNGDGYDAYILALVRFDLSNWFTDPAGGGLTFTDNIGQGAVNLSSSGIISGDITETTTLKPFKITVTDDDGGTFDFNGNITSIGTTNNAAHNYTGDGEDELIFNFRSDDHPKTLDGGAGTDTVSFGKDIIQFEITLNGGNIVVSDSNLELTKASGTSSNINNSQGSTTLVNVEVIVFGDGTEIVTDAPASPGTGQVGRGVVIGMANNSSTETLHGGNDGAEYTNFFYGGGGTGAHNINLNTAKNIIQFLDADESTATQTTTITGFTSDDRIHLANEDDMKMLTVSGSQGGTATVSSGATGSEFQFTVNWDSSVTNLLDNIFYIYNGMSAATLQAQSGSSLQPDPVPQGMVDFFADDGDSLTADPGPADVQDRIGDFGFADPSTEATPEMSQSGDDYLSSAFYS